MKDYSYLFTDFEDQAVDTQNPDDPVAKRIQEVAKENGITVSFNKVGQSGGATVMPLPNSATVDLTKGADNKWRVFL